MSFELRFYITAGGKDVFRTWFDNLRDRQAQLRIQLRLDRLERGLFGDVEPCGEGVSELRIDWGPGYRVYFACAGRELILFFSGGAKRTKNPHTKKKKKNYN